MSIVSRIIPWLLFSFYKSVPKEVIIAAFGRLPFATKDRINLRAQTNAATFAVVFCDNVGYHSEANIDEDNEGMKGFVDIGI